MTNFEDELRDALSRQEPPLGFAVRVMKRLPDETLPAPAHHRLIGWAAAAGVVLAIAAGAQYLRVQRAEERARGEAAAEQVLEALRFTATKLQMVQARVKEIGS
jgi:hypothetical protein